MVKYGAIGKLGNLILFPKLIEDVFTMGLNIYSIEENHTFAF